MYVIEMALLQNKITLQENDILFILKRKKIDMDKLLFHIKCIWKK